MLRGTERLGAVWRRFLPPGLRLCLSRAAPPPVPRRRCRRAFPATRGHVAARRALSARGPASPSSPEAAEGVRVPGPRPGPGAPCRAETAPGNVAAPGEYGGWCQPPPWGISARRGDVLGAAGRALAGQEGKAGGKRCSPASAGAFAPARSPPGWGAPAAPPGWGGVCCRLRPRFPPFPSLPTPPRRPRRGADREPGPARC